MADRREKLLGLWFVAWTNAVIPPAISSETDVLPNPFNTHVMGFSHILRHTHTRTHTHTHTKTQHTLKHASQATNACVHCYILPLKYVQWVLTLAGKKLKRKKLYCIAFIFLLSFSLLHLPVGEETERAREREESKWGKESEQRERKRTDREKSPKACHCCSLAQLFG